MIIATLLRLSAGIAALEQPLIATGQRVKRAAAPWLAVILKVIREIGPFLAGQRQNSAEPPRSSQPPLEPNSPRRAPQPPSDDELPPGAKTPTKLEPQEPIAPRTPESRVPQRVLPTSLHRDERRVRALFSGDEELPKVKEKDCDEMITELIVNGVVMTWNQPENRVGECETRYRQSIATRRSD